MSSFSCRQVTKMAVNKLIGKIGLRVVNASWGPRGFLDALQRVKRLGLTPRQIVDIGAASGEWTRECLQVFPDSDYFLVDPLQENRSFLKGLQDFYPRIKYWVGAVGPHAGRTDIHVHKDQSSIFKSEYSNAPGSNTRKVEIRTLDSFAEDHTINMPDFIKADVQGFEIEVLKGAYQCLKSAELLLLEVSYRGIYENAPLAHEVISYVASKGFRIFDICTYAVRPVDGELAQGDILFAKGDSKLFAYEGWGKP